MADSGCNFYELVKKIDENKILLPDFQREFVWRDEEKQRKIVASVLAKMPVGSILLLKSSPDEFVSKVVGTKDAVDVSKISDEVEFLLDGQQRITVLTNVFSNTIHNNCSTVGNLNSPSLKRRFFLKIPKWKSCTTDNDLFGVKEFEFPSQNPDTEDPKFLTNEILDLIAWEQFKSNGNEPYNPYVKLSTDLDYYCFSREKEYYYVPLFLLVDLGKGNHDVEKTYQRIINSMAGYIASDINDRYFSLDKAGKEQLLVQLKITEDEIKGIVESDSLEAEENALKSTMEWKIRLWQTNFMSYLKSCVTSMKLNLIEVEKSNRARAIDIYENLNMGGVSLNTFDLIMAKVAKVDHNNFYKRVIENILMQREYDTTLVPDAVRPHIAKRIENKKYNASENIGALNKNRNEISNTYVNAFLNVLSLYSCNPNFNAELYSKECMKQDKILSIDPEKIHENCEKICEGIDRCSFFLQTRCGIRSLKEVNYTLIIPIISVIFIRDDWYKDSKVHDLLEAWYWSVVFSGEFDKDQNVRMETNLKRLIKTINKENDVQWMNDMKSDILNAKNFSDKDFLLLENADVTERYPKRVLRFFIAQYFLARTYADMFDNTLTLSVFMQDAENLELHHIIPLASAKKVGESSKELRGQDNNILNSPLNFVWITSGANKDILAKSIQDYQMAITPEAYSKLHFSGYTATSNDDEIKKILDARHTSISGDIKTRVGELLLHWQR